MEARLLLFPQCVGSPIVQRVYVLEEVLSCKMNPNVHRNDDVSDGKTTQSMNQVIIYIELHMLPR